MFGLSKFWFFVLISVIGLLGAASVLVGNRRAIQDATNGGKTALIAKADAANLESFFETLGNSVALYAQRSSLERMDSTTADTLDQFKDQWGDTGLVSGVIFANKSGVVVFASNVAGMDTRGESVSDRDYFKWVTKQTGEGEFYIGKAIVGRFGPAKGKSIVTVTSPVFTKNTFLGSVTAPVIIEPVIKRHLELMKVSDKTNVFLIDQQGEYLYKSQGSQDLSGEIKSNFAAEGGHFERNGQDIAYSPVSLSDQKWFVVVSSPAEKGIKFHVLQAAVLISVSISTFLLGVYLSRRQNRL